MDFSLELIEWSSFEGSSKLQVRLSLRKSQVASQVGAYPGFCGMKGIFLLLLDGMLV